MQNWLMTLFQAIKNLFSSRRIATPQDLQGYLEGRSAFYVQKSITEYSQARANMAFSTLLGESGFQKAFEESRWKAFPAGLSAVAEVLTGALRERLSLDAELATEHVQAAANHIVATYPIPDFAERHYWDEALEKLESDLARATLAAPRPAHAIAQTRAQEIFDALPFHTAIRKHDFEMFRNTLSFQLSAIGAELSETKIEPGAAPRP
jgi:hypothetical protein